MWAAIIEKRLLYCLWERSQYGYNAGINVIEARKRKNFRSATLAKSSYEMDL